MKVDAKNNAFLPTVYNQQIQSLSCVHLNALKMETNAGQYE